MIVSIYDCCNTLSQGEPSQREICVFLTAKEMMNTQERQITV